MTERFQFAAMLPMVRSRFRPPSRHVTTISDVGKAAEVLGVARQTVYRWQRDGLTREQADHAASLLGLNPASIWPEWFADAHPDPRNVMLLKPDRRSLLPQPPYKPCGTNAAAKRHRRNSEPLDDACRLAERAYTLPFVRAHRAGRMRR